MRKVPDRGNRNRFRLRTQVVTTSMTDIGVTGSPLDDDPEAFRTCYEELGPFVLAYVRRFVPRDEAEDVRQQVFLEVWRSRSRFDGDRRLEPWVLAIAKRRAIDHLRRISRTPTHPVAELPARRPDGTRAFTDVHAEASEIRDALDVLSAEQRETLELAYFHDMTQPQIAAQLGVPLGTVKARSFRGLRKLAATLMPREEINLGEEGS
jgi:RNA polymerase sigma-70 factor (ECF subfamily)